jgi:hypothetical protein
VAAELQYARGYTEAGAGGKAGDPIWFVASTPGVKRDGLDLRANGWRLDNYRRSPVFQWCHDRTAPPLGRVEADAGERLRTGVLFDQEDPFARKIEGKYRRGFLHAVSVGWDFVDAGGQRMDPKRMTLDDVRDRAFYDLAEVSGVPVPADPDALMESQRAGLRSLSRDLVKLFDEVEDERSPVTADEIRPAVLAELRRLGVPIPSSTTPPSPVGVPETAARDFLAALKI